MYSSDFAILSMHINNSSAKWCSCWYFCLYCRPTQTFPCWWPEWWSLQSYCPLFRHWSANTFRTYSTFLVISLTSMWRSQVRFLVPHCIVYFLSGSMALGHEINIYDIGNYMSFLGVMLKVVIICYRFSERG